MIRAAILAVVLVACVALSVSSQDGPPIFGGDPAPRRPAPAAPPTLATEVDELSPPEPIVEPSADESTTDSGDGIVSGEDMEQAIDLLNDSRLTMVCVFGAIGGAVLAIALFPQPTPRQMAAKFGASMVSGGVFTPALIEWLELPIRSSYVLAGSAVVAMVAVGVLHTVIPLVEKMWTTRLAARLHVDPPKPEAEQPKTGKEV